MKQNLDAMRLTISKKSDMGGKTMEIFIIGCALFSAGIVLRKIGKLTENEAIIPLKAQEKSIKTKFCQDSV